MITERSFLIEEGREEGRKEGEEVGRRKTAKRMLKRGRLTYEEIAEDSGLTLEEVTALAK